MSGEGLHRFTETGDDCMELVKCIVFHHHTIYIMLVFLMNYIFHVNCSLQLLSMILTAMSGSHISPPHI